jgi:tRNA/rRNA methyltransferase
MRFPKFRFILVRTEYEINLGFAARLLANFGQSKLYLVNPQCQIGFTAKMYAKHAEKLLGKAIICSTLKQATEGCSLVVGTTGVLWRHRQALRHPLTVEEFRDRIARCKWEKNSQIAILFGPEGNGLSESEILECDLLITIPTSRKYPVMNLSHSLAVVLYALLCPGKKLFYGFRKAKAGDIKALAQTFDLFVERYQSTLRNPKKVKLAFRRIISRALPDEVELGSVMGVLRQAWRELQKNSIEKDQK